MLSNKLTRTSLLLFVIAFLLGVPLGPAQTSNMVSICDVLAEPKKYDGQLVTIRAAFVSRFGDTDFDEFAPIESDRCHKPTRETELRLGITNILDFDNPPRNWILDVASFERADNILWSLLSED